MLLTLSTSYIYIYVYIIANHHLPDLARGLGSTLGVTAASALYQNILNTRLWERFGSEPNAAERIGRILEDLEELKRLEGHWREGAMQSFMEGFKGVWVMFLCVAVLALLCISRMQQYELHSTLDRKSRE